MSAKRTMTIGVLFGGRSVEHDVSIVTGQQIMRACDPARYEVVPIYIDRSGRWMTGEPLREIKTFQGDVSSVRGVETVVLSPNPQQRGLLIDPLRRRLGGAPPVLRLDVVFPALHGSHGEDGTVQGLLELADIPYVGCGVLASAVANDKALTKAVLRDAGIPVVGGVVFARHEWQANPDEVLARIHAAVTYPAFVKPVTLGSSIGIARADDETMLRASVEVALNLDRRVMVESAVVGCIEINCALLGDARDLTASVLEQPVSWEQFLTYEDKYLRGGEGMKSAERLIPAPIDADLTERIQSLARRAFLALDGHGTGRIDFLVKPDAGEVYLNEINTLPGSFAFYLWSDMGMPPSAVVDRLVEIARDAYAEKRRNTYDYRTNLVNLTAARGLKGAKGGKSNRSR